MAFSKTFPRNVPGSNYPVWEEIFLTFEEEQKVEESCRKQNMEILNECLFDAKQLAIRKGLNDDSNVINLAVALFEKRASHLVFLKEAKAKEKFDQRPIQQ